MTMLSMNQLTRAARLYCEGIRKDPDELILDALTMEKTLPRWEKIRDRMVSNQFEAAIMRQVLSEKEAA